MDEKDVVHIHNGISLSHEKNEITPFAVIQMDLEIIILSEVSAIEDEGRQGPRTSVFRPEFPLLQPQF